MKVINRKIILKNIAATVICLCTLCFTSALSLASSWQMWDKFSETFMSADGRIIDLNSTKSITTSEGQAYGLFFALVAGDKKHFHLMLDWTIKNLADGDLTTTLPAWLWGKSDEGDWRVLDSNSASDVDLWLAYNLLEAGRIWHQKEYTDLGRKLLRLIYKKEVVEIPGLGPTLLPGQMGFAKDKSWVLNPSYSPIHLLNYMARIDNRWQPVIASSMKLLIESAPRGYSPDWVEYRLNEGFNNDFTKYKLGSYNAIRVYLWAGMLHEDDDLRPILLEHFKPMVNFIEHNEYVPEEVNVQTEVTTNRGSVGFTAASLPFLEASGSLSGLVSQLSTLIKDPLSNYSDSYYSQSLGLFGLGFQQNEYCFSLNGQLMIGGECL